MTIYIPSKNLKIFGLSLSGICLLLFAASLIIYNKSGEIVATAQLTTPINKESIISHFILCGFAADNH